MRVTLDHARAVLQNMHGNRRQGYCLKGMKQFAKRHNLNFKQFAKEGIEEEELLKTGDAMAKLIVDFANGVK